MLPPMAYKLLAITFRGNFLKRFPNTVRSISKAYMESLRQKQKVGSSAEVKTLPAKKRG